MLELADTGCPSLTRASWTRTCFSLLGLPVARRLKVGVLLLSLSSFELSLSFLGLDFGPNVGEVRITSGGSPSPVL
jgi:hypothetical protein